MQISLHAHMKWTNRGIFQQKLQKNAVLVKSVLDSDCDCFSDTARRENFNLKPKIWMKKLIPKTQSTIPSNTRK